MNMIRILNDISSEHHTIISIEVAKYVSNAASSQIQFYLTNIVPEICVSK